VPPEVALLRYAPDFCSSWMLALELLHHVRVAERSDVPERAALGDVAQ